MSKPQSPFEGLEALHRKLNEALRPITEPAACLEGIQSLRTLSSSFTEIASPELMQNLRTVTSSFEEALRPVMLLAPHEPLGAAAQRRVTAAPIDVGKTGISKPEPINTSLCVRKLGPPKRTPDLELSRKRLDLLNTLASELATIKQELEGFCSAEDLRKKYPEFVLWKLIGEAELRELIEGDAFAPKAYAENLTLRASGITSRETLKKDRKKLRKAQKAKQI